MFTDECNRAIQRTFMSAGTVVLTRPPVKTRPNLMLTIIWKIISKAAAKATSLTCQAIFVSRLLARRTRDMTSLILNIKKDLRLVPLRTIATLQTHPES